MQSSGIPDSPLRMQHWHVFTWTSTRSSMAGASGRKKRNTTPIARWRLTRTCLRDTWRKGISFGAQPKTIHSAKLSRNFKSPLICIPTWTALTGSWEWFSRTSATCRRASWHFNRLIASTRTTVGCGGRAWPTFGQASSRQPIASAKRGFAKVRKASTPFGCDLNRCYSWATSKLPRRCSASHSTNSRKNLFSSPFKECFTRRKGKRSELSNVRNERVNRRALSVIHITLFIRWRASTRSWARLTRPLHGWIGLSAPGFAAGRSFELTHLSATCVDYPRFKTILPRSRRTAARFVFPRFEPANHCLVRFHVTENQTRALPASGAQTGSLLW